VAPTWKFLKFIKSNIEDLIKRPRNFISVNSVRLIEGLVKLQANENDRIIKPKVQDFYVNFLAKDKFILEVFSIITVHIFQNLSIIKLISECLKACWCCSPEKHGHPQSTFQLIQHRRKEVNTNNIFRTLYFYTE